MNFTLKRILSTIWKVAEDKKALDSVILDLRKLTSVADYFFICSGESTTQVRAIANGIIEKLKEKKIKLWHDEGCEEARWVLLDYSAIVIHVFYKETREFYNLEGLWADAPQVKGAVAQR